MAPELARLFAGRPQILRLLMPSLKSSRLLIVVNNASFLLSHRMPIALAAKDAGFDVWALSPPGPDVRRLEAAGLRTATYDLSRSGTHPLVEARSVLSLTRLYRKLRPDVIHHVSLKPVLYGTIAARLARMPAVVNAVAGLGYVFNSKRRTLRETVSAALRIGLTHPNAYTIFQNPHDRDLLVGRKIVDPARVILIRGSGVDLASFVPLPAPEGPPIVMLAARLLWEKGVGEFVEAARSLRDKGGRFVLVGDTDMGNPGAVPSSQLREWDRSGVIEWWGARSDMPAVLSQAAIVSLPSYYGEGVPKVLIEAAACGRPIVTTTEPGCREVVEEGANGLLVPPRDASKLADAFAALLADPVRRQRMGERGRTKSVAEFDVRNVVRETLDLYRKAMNRRADRARVM